jgi:uncharacterized protein (DUF3820 family)
MHGPPSPFYDPMPFGKHKGRVLPDLILHETNYYFWASDEGVLEEVFDTWELDRLSQRLTAIKIRPGQDPTVARVADYHYRRHGPLSDVIIRSESEPSSSHTQIVKPRKELDIAFSRRRRKTRYHKNAYAPVIAAIYEEYFPGATVQITAAEAIKFFSTRSNFLRGI